MRQTFGDHRQLCHVWAQQTQSYGRANSMFFEGESIFSYGHHFKIAQFVTRKGQTAVLFTTDSYSSSTAKHISFARSAVSHHTVFHVPHVAGGSFGKPADMFKSYQPRVDRLLVEAGRARSRGEWLFGEARRMVEEANQFAEFFGLKSRLTLPADFAAAVADARAKDEAAKKRDEARRAAAERKARQENEKALAEWLSGERDYLPSAHLLEHDLLRVKGEEVQTTRGARVPVEHAKRAYSVLKKLHDRQETYKANGHTIHVGHYTIDEMDAGGFIKAGCHNIEWSEVERLAQVAGWNQ